MQTQTRCNETDDNAKVVTRHSGVHVQATLVLSRGGGGLSQREGFPRYREFSCLAGCGDVETGWVQEAPITLTRWAHKTE